MISYRFSLLSLITLAACGVETTDLDLPADLREDTSARSEWDGTPEGIALLDFLNSESCTQDLLDYEVPLDRRAAGNIIAHRDGGDRLFGTSDDDLYNNITELDDVRWVGSRTINRMRLIVRLPTQRTSSSSVMLLYRSSSLVPNKRSPPSR